MPQVCALSLSGYCCTRLDSRRPGVYNVLALALASHRHQDSELTELLPSPSRKRKRRQERRMVEGDSVTKKQIGEEDSLEGVRASHQEPLFDGQLFPNLFEDHDENKFPILFLLWQTEPRIPSGWVRPVIL
ncbi:hypothetical protein J6590_054654 [Homalodisca vitripennis]|nr:hypothetical protein J6590_054654 [Homalodisca vitripennis]